LAGPHANGVSSRVERVLVGSRGCAVQSAWMQATTIIRPRPSKARLVAPGPRVRLSANRATSACSRASILTANEAHTNHGCRVMSLQRDGGSVLGLCAGPLASAGSFVEGCSWVSLEGPLGIGASGRTQLGGGCLAWADVASAQPPRRRRGPPARLSSLAAAAPSSLQLLCQLSWANACCSSPLSWRQHPSQTSCRRVRPINSPPAEHANSALR